MTKFELKVFITTREASCDECGEDLGRRAWIMLVEDKGALCLACADLDHLVFLPAGDAALTRRSRKYSTLCAVVLKWSRARKRYERQGLLVEIRGVGAGRTGVPGRRGGQSPAAGTRSGTQGGIGPRVCGRVCRARARAVPLVSSRARSRHRGTRLSQIQRARGPLGRCQEL